MISWCGGWDSNPRRPTPRDSTPAFCQGTNRSDAFALLGLECSARVPGATRPFSQIFDLTLVPPLRGTRQPSQICLKAYSPDRKHMVEIAPTHVLAYRPKDIIALTHFHS